MKTLKCSFPNCESDISNIFLEYNQLIHAAPSISIYMSRLFSRTRIRKRPDYLLDLTSCPSLRGGASIRKCCCLVTIGNCYCRQAPAGVQVIFRLESTQATAKRNMAEVRVSVRFHVFN